MLIQNIIKYLGKLPKLSAGIILIILGLPLAILTVSNSIIIPSSAEILPNDLEEVRDNLAEAREELQKGGLISTIQHINQADQLLLSLMSNATASE
jgi:hypothetical protein